MDAKTNDLEFIINFPKINLAYAKDLIEEKKIDVNELLTLEITSFSLSVVHNVTLLYAAITNQDERLVYYLLAKNADVNIPICHNLCNAVHKAIKTKNLSILKQLIDHGADLEHSIQPSNDKPLHTAIKTKDCAVIKFLIDSGVRVKKIFQSWVGQPSEWLHCENFSDIIELLWKSGADFLQYKTPLKFYSAMLTEAIKQGLDYKIKTLLTLEATVCPTYFNGEDGKTYPVLRKCLNWQGLDSLIWLLEYPKFEPAFLNIVSEDNRSLLHVAIFIEKFKIPNNKFYRQNLGLKARLESYNPVINHLLNAGIDVNILDSYDNLAIDYIDRDNAMWILKVKEHIVKLIAAGYYVCQRNIDAVKSEEFDDLREQCQQEIKKMKAMRIENSNLSYYKLLRLSVHKCTIYLKNTNVPKLLSRNFSNSWEKTSSEMFPLYGGLIYYQLVRVPKRIELSKKSEGVLEEIFRNKLPYDFIIEIYRYLSIDDLRMLTE